MNNTDVINGRDVNILINERQILQSESIEIYTLSDTHKIRSCFRNDDIAHIKGNKGCKVILTNLRFKEPFNNFNFYDLDNFELKVICSGMKITLKGCMWNEIITAADKLTFREKLSITALNMIAEKEDTL